MREVPLTVQHGRDEGPSPYRERTFPIFRWAAVRYGWLIALLALAGAVAATQFPVLTGGQTTYETAAIVAARELSIDAEQLPRTAAAIFSAGEVAETAVELAEVDYDTLTLVPDRVRVEPVENTIVMRVVAVDADPEVAAALANGAARGLVIELQKLGPGVGDFAVHTTAPVPAAPASGPPVPPILVGLLAGAIFGLGLVGLWVAVRKPVTDAGTAAAVTGHPILASLALSTDDTTGDLRSIPRLGALAGALYPKSKERRYLVGVHVRRRTMRLLGIVLARYLTRSGESALVGARVKEQPFGTDEELASLLVSEDKAPARDSGVPTVVLGRFLPDGTDPRRDDRWVLVVGQGAPLTHLQAAVEELGDVTVEGLVFLRPLGWRDISRRYDPQVV